MATDKFPYDEVGKDALEKLIEHNFSDQGFKKGFIDIGEVFHAPTEQDPGKTYVKVNNLRTAKTYQIIYDKLDITKVLALKGVDFLEEAPGVMVLGTISSSAVVKAINLKYGLRLDYTDVETFATAITGSTYTVFELNILPTSYVYYGKALVYVNVNPSELDYLITEDGDEILTTYAGYNLLLESNNLF